MRPRPGTHGQTVCCPRPEDKGRLRQFVVVANDHPLLLRCVRGSPRGPGPWGAAQREFISPHARVRAGPGLLHAQGSPFLCALSDPVAKKLPVTRWWMRRYERRVPISVPGWVAGTDQSAKSSARPTARAGNGPSDKRPATGDGNKGLATRAWLQGTGYKGLATRDWRQWTGG